MITDEERERLQFAARAWFDEKERIRFTARAWFEAGWQSLGRRVLRLLVLAALVYVAWRSHSIVTTLIGAGIFASAAGALAHPLQRLRLPLKVQRLPLFQKFAHVHLSPHGRRALCSAVALLVLLGMLVGIVMAFLKPFQDQVNDLKVNWPKYQPQLVQKFDDFKAWYQKQPDWVRNIAPEQVKNLLDDKTLDSAAPAPASRPVEMSPGVTDALTGAFQNIGKGIGSLVELILLPILAFYFLVDGRALRNEFVRFLPHRRQHRAALAILKESGEIMRSYLLAQLLLALIAGVVIGCLLGIFGIKYALILALVAGVTRAVPVIGPLLGGIPVGVLVFVQCAEKGQYGIVAFILIIFTLMHLAESKIITPMILGHRLHLHPVVIILALLLGGEFFGLLGMFLAAPVMALLRTVLLHLYVYPRRAKAVEASRLQRAFKPKPLTSKD